MIINVSSQLFSNDDAKNDHTRVGGSSATPGDDSVTSSNIRHDRLLQLQDAHAL